MTLLLALILGCSTPTPDPVAEALAQPLPDDSIYQLEAVLETQSGAKVDLSTYRGHPTLVSMFYANCPMACPMLIQEVRGLEGQLSEEDLADTRVLLVSLDPDRDSPEVMQGVVDTHDLDTTRWTLSRTDEGTVREVAAVLGIHYRSLDDGEMNHSSIVTLVDRQGRVVAQHEGLGKESNALLEKLSAL